MFHPHGWIRNDQIVALVEHVASTHGKKAKFLTFKECLERINKHLLAGQPVRAADGGDNGVRLLDLNNDGYMDVVIGNDQLQLTRVWNPQGRKWIDSPLPAKIVHVDAQGRRVLNQVRFGIVDTAGLPMMLLANDTSAGAWQFDGKQWISDERLLEGLKLDGQPVLTGHEGRDRGVRLLDIDGDGRCELIVANPEQRGALAWNAEQHAWHQLPFAPPEAVSFVDAQGRDGGTRWADVDADGMLDLLDSCERGSSCSCSTRSPAVGHGSQPLLAQAEALPRFASAGMNGGAWIADRQVWLQNEETQSLAGRRVSPFVQRNVGRHGARPLERGRPVSARSTFRRAFAWSWSPPSRW